MTSTRKQHKGFPPFLIGETEELFNNSLESIAESIHHPNGPSIECINNVFKLAETIGEHEFVLSLDMFLHKQWWWVKESDIILLKIARIIETLLNDRRFEQFIGKSFVDLIMTNQRVNLAIKKHLITLPDYIDSLSLLYELEN